MFGAAYLGKSFFGASYFGAAAVSEDSGPGPGIDSVLGGYEYIARMPRRPMAQENEEALLLHL
jgi:hypothetical protein